METRSAKGQFQRLSEIEVELYPLWVQQFSYHGLTPTLVTIYKGGR